VIKIDTLGNMEIRLWPDDTRKHRQPHFHAAGPDRSAVIALPGFEVIVGDLRAKELDAVLAWAAKNKKRLVAEWNRLNRQAPITE